MTPDWTPEFKVASSHLSEIASAACVRARCRRVLDSALGGGTAFQVNPDRIGAAVDRVLAVTRRDYPSGDVPFHARWEHFKAGGHDRVGEWRSYLKDWPADEISRAKLDLAVVSVLLDAGAGPRWKFEGFERSEGLALASLRMFLDGKFSSDPKAPWRADHVRLRKFTVEDLREGFRVSARNPLVGLEGRAELLRRLGDELARHEAFVRPGIPERRPSHWLDSWRAEHPAGVTADRMLTTVLLTLEGMWPARVRVNGVGFGDVWAPSADAGFKGLIPFHKLSQWLTYSLIEPVQEAGLPVTGIESLTGLPEYRNGGLFLDLAVLEPRDPAALQGPLTPASLVVIEWRALTVALLDQVAEEFRRRLGKTPAELPLARVLQGGTWTAGRELALERRPDGAPPFPIESDGTVF